MSLRTTYDAPSTSNTLPMTKEQALERFMDHMISMQKMQARNTFKVAQAVAKLDTSGEILPFFQAKQDFDYMYERIDAAEELKSAWERAR